MNFTVKCDKCGSDDVSVSAIMNDFDHIEVWAYCRECKNHDEISG